MFYFLRLIAYLYYMKTAIIGSRTAHDYQQLLGAIAGLTITEVISGGAKGADQLAERFAQEHGLRLTVIKPDWVKGKEAGPLRNQQIVEAAEQVLALWDGQSKGTADTIRRAKQLKKPLRVVMVAQQNQLPIF